MTEYRLEMIDLSGSAEILENDLEEATKLLNDCAMGGWEVVSLVPFEAQKHNQYVALLKKQAPQR